ncbi:MAG: hypothetical protein SOW37_02210, partial [Fusobacterium perfoetens]|uniref:hypothetical protein n=1 Tax=Fusobacterium perfoetens TaxID=852 RepID=UPI002A7620CF
MVKDIEKNLKRWLKRKVKITMEVIVAFLIGSSLSFADTLYIRDGANGIEFSLDNQNWGENPYSENTFENNIYVNKKKIESDKVGVVNNATNVFIINNNIISVNSKNKARGIDNSGTITKLENNGLLEINGTSDATGIGNYKGIIKNLQNNGLITGKGYYIGIENFDGIVLKLENKGIIMSEESDSAIGIDNIMKNDGIIDNLINKGIIDLKGNSNVSGIQNNIGGTIRDLLNQGIIKVEADSKPVKGIANVSNQIENISNEGIIDVIGNSEAIGINFPAKKETKNKGIIKVTSSSNATGIDLGGILENKNENLLNEGIIDVIGSNNGRAIRNIQEINNFINNGILKTKGKGKPIFTAAIFSNSEKINNLEQNGIVFSNRVTIKIPASNTSNIINNGLLIGDSSDFIKNGYDNNGVIFSYDNVNNNYKIQRYKDTGENGIQIGNKTIINAIFTDEQNKNQNNWTATGSESIVLEDNKTDMIYNGITNALKVGGEKTLTNSIVNGYTSAIVFDENGGSLTLDNSIINGGVDETSATIKGSNNIDNLTLTNGTIINGNIDLGNGNDNLTLDDKTQINGDLLGGDGEDTLTFNNSTTKSNDDNINIFGSIHSFENMKIDTNVTFFENTKITGTENITISENGKMIVRVGIEKTNGKLNNHVLNNTGAIVSGDGILSVNLNGNGVGSIIGMGEDSKTQISDDLNIESYSALHIIKKNSNGDLEVLKKEFASPEKYQNLKDIYDSIFASKQDDEFTDTSSEKYGEFLKYLNDIYAGTPYSYSTEISRKTLTMFDEIAISKDLNPDLKSWAIYGGLTHIDGGNKN